MTAQREEWPWAPQGCWRDPVTGRVWRTTKVRSGRRTGCSRSTATSRKGIGEAIISSVRSPPTLAPNSRRSSIPGSQPHSRSATDSRRSDGSPLPRRPSIPPRRHVQSICASVAGKSPPGAVRHSGRSLLLDRLALTACWSSRDRRRRLRSRHRGESCGRGFDLLEFLCEQKLASAGGDTPRPGHRRRDP